MSNEIIKCFTLSSHKCNSIQRETFEAIHLKNSRAFAHLFKSKEKIRERGKAKPSLKPQKAFN